MSSVAFALLLTGCGGGADQSQPEAAPQNKLEPAACAELTTANLDLAMATTGPEAQKASDVFRRYDAPAKVTEAIDRVVAAGGVTFDGADFDAYNQNIDAWVREVCPV